MQNIITANLKQTLNMGQVLQIKEDVDHDGERSVGSHFPGPKDSMSQIDLDMLPS